MKILYPKTVKVQMDEPNGFYFDVELVESPDGMMFEGWLYHPDFSIKSHIVSVQAETVQSDETVDWLPVICMMNEYLHNQCLISNYWEQIELLEY